MARDDPPASSTASSTAAAMRGKVGSEFETYISYNAPMHFHHRQTDRQTDTDIEHKREMYILHLALKTRELENYYMTAGYMENYR